MIARERLSGRGKTKAIEVKNSLTEKYANWTTSEPLTLTMVIRLEQANSTACCAFQGHHSVRYPGVQSNSKNLGELFNAKRANGDGETLKQTMGIYLFLLVDS